LDGYTRSTAYSNIINERYVQKNKSGDSHWRVYMSGLEKSEEAATFQVRCIAETDSPGLGAEAAFS
jgi:hypothetical protein